MQTTNPGPTLHGPATGKMLRPFTGQIIDGRTIRSQSYRQRSNLVLLFHHGRDCAPCQKLLSDIGAHINDVRDQAAAVLAIGPDGEPGPVPMLIDPSGEIAKQQGLAAPAVVIVDRFGEFWAAWEGRADHQLPHADDVIEWLEFLEVQCPECEPPEPWGDES